MMVNVIYDNRWSEDYERLHKEFLIQNITEYHFWDAIRHNDSVVRSISDSHKMIVQWAKDHNMPEVCIAEQDVFFPSERGWGWFLINKPESFDIYAAANYISFPRNGQVGAIKIDELCGFQLYIISEKYYDKFLETRGDRHIDSEQKGDLYFCYPMAALQRSGYSVNNRQVVNYNYDLKPGDIYR